MGMGLVLIGIEGNGSGWLWKEKSGRMVWGIVEVWEWVVWELEFFGKEKPPSGFGGLWCYESYMVNLTT